MLLQLNYWLMVVQYLDFVHMPPSQFSTRWQIGKKVFIHTTPWSQILPLNCKTIGIFCLYNVRLSGPPAMLQRWVAADGLYNLRLSILVSYVAAVRSPCVSPIHLFLCYLKIWNCRCSHQPYNVIEDLLNLPMSKQQTFAMITVMSNFITTQFSLHICWYVQFQSDM